MINKPIDPAILRAEAEAKITRKPVKLVNPQPQEELLHGLMHELRVHQIELDMQNEELRRLQVALEESRDRYVDLYEFAPVGYLTLSTEGVITGANLTGASMLGVDRKNLLKRRFSHLVIPEDRVRWQQYFLQAHQPGERQVCELAVQRPDGSVLQVRVDSQYRKLDSAPELRITLVDITELNR